MGDRVAVMRKGELQQVDDAQELYDRPLNLFVAGFIGSPAMNLLEATLEKSGEQLRRAPRLADARARRRGASPRTRRSRPTWAARSSSASAPRTSRTRRWRRGARRDRRAQGQGRAHGGARLRDHGALLDRRDARRHRGRARAPGGHRRRIARPAAASAPQAGSAVLVGRFNPRSRVQGRRHDRGRRRHALAPLLRSRDRSRDLRQTLLKGDHMSRLRISCARSRRRDRRAHRAGHDGQRRTSHKKYAVSGNLSLVGIWTGAEQKNFQLVLDGFQKKFPDVKRQVHLGRRQHADGALDRDRRRQPARSRGGRPARPRQAVRRRARRSSRSTSSSRRCRRTTRRRGSRSARTRGSSTAWSSRAPTSRRSGTRSRPSRTPA